MKKKKKGSKNRPPLELPDNFRNPHDPPTICGDIGNRLQPYHLHGDAHQYVQNRPSKLKLLLLLYPLSGDYCVSLPWKALSPLIHHLAMSHICRHPSGLFKKLTPLIISTVACTPSNNGLLLTRTKNNGLHCGWNICCEMQVVNLIHCYLFSLSDNLIRVKLGLYNPFTTRLISLRVQII